MNIVLHDLDFNFQGQTFSCYAFAILKNHRQQMSLADLPQLAQSQCRVGLVLFVSYLQRIYFLFNIEYTQFFVRLIDLISIPGFSARNSISSLLCFWKSKNIISHHYFVNFSAKYTAFIIVDQLTNSYCAIN